MEIVKNNEKGIIFYVVFIVIFVIAILIMLSGMFHNNDKKLSKLDASEYNDVDSLMIVAHPDDETLWGFKELQTHNCLVVCVTCGSNKVREDEIERVLKFTDDKLISLGYTDKFLGHRSRWEHEYKRIESDLERIMNLKDWKRIVTHNAEGEYGHIHHKMIHEMLLDIHPKNLNYFGKYYTKKRLSHLDEKDTEIYKLDDETLNLKRKMLKNYKSQEKVVEVFSHMVPFENMI